MQYQVVFVWTPYRDLANAAKGASPSQIWLAGSSATSWDELLVGLSYAAMKPKARGSYIRVLRGHNRIPTSTILHVDSSPRGYFAEEGDDEVVTVNILFISVSRFGCGHRFSVFAVRL